LSSSRHRGRTAGQKNASRVSSRPVTYRISVEPVKSATDAA
jgi:hypothetical protein